MGETSQTKDWASVGNQSVAGAGSDSKEAKQTEVGLDETIPMLLGSMEKELLPNKEAKHAEVGLVEILSTLPGSPEKDIPRQLPRKEAMLLSRAHYSEAKAAPKKLKQSHTSGDDLLELNVPTQGPSAGIGKSNQLISGRTFLRMLIPAEIDGHVMDNIQKICEQIKAKITICPGVGVKVLVVLNEEDYSASSSPAVEGLDALLAYLLDQKSHFHSSCPFRLARLLVSAAQARLLIRSDTFGTIADGCFFNVYLTDIFPIVSFGDVIVELQGLPKRVIKAVIGIASYLSQFPVDESLSGPNIQTDTTMGRVPLKSIMSTSEEDESDLRISAVKADRRFEVQHFTRMPLTYAENLIGEKGANIERIQKSTRATIFIAPLTFDEVRINVYGASLSDVEVGEKLVEDLIGKTGVFEHVLENMFVLPNSPVEGEEWY